MTIAEVESYYGKEAADWVRDRIADGTFKITPFRYSIVVRLRNPKYKGGFLKFSEAIPYYDDGIVKLPDHLRHSDIVRIEIDLGDIKRMEDK